MKKMLTILTSLTMTVASTAAFASSEQQNAQGDSQGVEVASDLEGQLANQQARLVEFQESLKKAKRARAGWLTLTVTAGAVSVVAAIPGIMMVSGGVKNLSNGVQFLGDPDNGGGFMIPVVIATTAISAGSGYGAYKSYQQIELRDADIAALLKKIEAKQIEIANTQELLKTMH